MEQDFTATRITMQDQVRFSAGKAVHVTHLQFYVGDNGPFMHDFAGDNNSTALIQAFIQQKVADVRAITTRQY